ncbi:MAG: hypothetical protein HC883_01770 [Bdellovibrionaceae bacterium]|nr:hypothetical protein [Pseudobdellovibrionaceae bacterium]
MASSVRIRSTYGAKRAVINLVAGSTEGLTYYLYLLPGCQNSVDCANTCTISGVSKSDLGDYVYEMNGTSATVVVECTDVLTSVWFYYYGSFSYVFATSMTISTITNSPVDLSVGAISLFAKDGSALSTDSSGNAVLATTTPPSARPAPKAEPEPIKVRVPVVLSKATTGIVDFKLMLGDQLLASKNLDLGQLSEGSNAVEMMFPPPTNRSLLGVSQLRAVINSSQSVVETNFDNNRSPVRLVNTMVLCDAEKLRGRKVPFFPQVGRSWSSNLYGIPERSSVPGSTIARFGCSIADLAMLFKWFGIDNTPIGAPLNAYPPFLDGLRGEPMDPGSLNYAMANYRVRNCTDGSLGFNSDNNILWKGAADLARASGQHEVSFMRNLHLAGPLDNAIESVQNEICAGNAVIVKLRNAVNPGLPESSETRQHFVLAKAIALDSARKRTLKLNNPGLERGENQFYSSISRNYPSFAGFYVFHDLAFDPSMIDIMVPMNVHILVTDPMGRRTGYDPTTNTSYSEIPGTDYGVQSTNTPAEDESDPVTLVSERAFSSWSDAIGGTYKIQVFAIKDGDYYIDYRSYDTAGDFNDSLYRTGTLSAGQTVSINLNHSTESIRPSNAGLTIEDYSIMRSGKRNSSLSRIILAGKIKPQGGAGLSLTSQFKISLGGLMGYSLTVPGSAFKSRQEKIGKSKITTYVHRDQGTEIMLHSTGEVKVIIPHADLSSLDPDSQFGEIEIEADSITADEKVNVECFRGLCTMRKRHDHHQCKKNGKEHHHPINPRSRSHR